MSLEGFKAVLFRVGDEEFGMSIQSVMSIEKMQKCTVMPNMPAYMIGVTTLRDVVTPVLDLRKVFGSPIIDENTTRIIVVHYLEKHIGLVVDATTDVIDLKTECLQKPSFVNGRQDAYLLGFAKLEERLIPLIDPDRLLEQVTV